MYTASVIANNILGRSLGKISPMKLQKLLYITYKEYLTCTGRKLFNEPFEAWRYGPVVRCVYDEFKPFGSQAITEYAKNVEGKAYMIDEKYDSNLEMILNSVFSEYANTTGVELSKKTHTNEGSAWAKALECHRAIIEDGDITTERSYLR